MELTFTAQSISDLMAYSQIIFKSGLFKRFTSAEEIFVTIEAGREIGLTPIKALESVRIENGIVVSGLGSDPSPSKPISSPNAASNPEPVSNTVSVVASAVASVAVSSSAIVKQIKEELDADPENPHLQPHEMKDEDAIETYLAWIEQAEGQKQLDMILYRLKFEEGRESVKAAVRQAFKKKSDEVKAQEVAQNSAVTFRAQPTVKADDHKNLEVLPKRDSVNQQENYEHAEEQHAVSSGDRGSDAELEGQAVDYTISFEADPLLAQMRAAVSFSEFVFTDDERERLILKFNKCNSADELYAAAEPIFLYYQKKNNINLSPLLDKLCSIRMKHILTKKEGQSWPA